VKTGAVSVAIVLMLLAAAVPGGAQEPPPRVGPLALDFHVTVPKFPDDDAQLAASRGLMPQELPGSGLGIQTSAHVYLFKVKVITVGIGAEFAASRARKEPNVVPTTTTTPTTSTTLHSTEERFSTFSPQLSLNFGTGHGWSYLSGGIGVSNWALVPEGQATSPLDSESLRTLNWGGGARWFAKSHLAFSFDVRFYRIDAGSVLSDSGYGGPPATLMIIGAGISLKP
jgi:hypothetical protein